LTAAKDCADASDKLARIERLSEVVIGAELETDDPVYVFFQRSEQNDRDIRSPLA
jgi:hypothetical protein